MTIHVARDVEASELLSTDSFQARWSKLFDACPWATAFQSPEFVLTWYEFYRKDFRPVVIWEAGEGEKLTGLLTLAACSSSGQLVMAGAHQAEYQTWLTSRESDSFIGNALCALEGICPGGLLTFRYLPVGTPTDWINDIGGWSGRCSLESWRRPIVNLTDSSEVLQYLAQKKKRRSTKSYINQLKRIGPLRFERIRTAAELDPIFKELIAYYDARQGAIHGDMPFRDDPQKRGFHLALLRFPDLLHVTVLRAGSEITSAQFGISGKKNLTLAMPIFSPFHAQQSPITLHYLMLVEKSFQEGFSILDLTPGESGFKDRFATSHEQVYVLRAYFRRKDLVRYNRKKRIEEAAKSCLKRLGISPRAVAGHWERVWEKARRVRWRDLPKILRGQMGKITQKLWSKRESRAYLHRPEDVSRLENPRRMSRDCVDDLLAFEPSEIWQSHSGFLAESLRRLERGDHIYTLVENGRLVHFGWLSQCQQKATFPEVGQEIWFPPGTAVLYDFYTDPGARGRGLYRASLSQMLQDAAAGLGRQLIFIAVEADNHPSRHVIEKLGFSYAFSLFRTIKLGRLKRWSTELPAGWVTESSGAPPAAKIGIKDEVLPANSA